MEEDKPEPIPGLRGAAITLLVGLLILIVEMVLMKSSTSDASADIDRGMNGLLMVVGGLIVMVIAFAVFIVASAAHAARKPPANQSAPGSTAPRSDPE